MAKHVKASGSNLTRHEQFTSGETCGPFFFVCVYTLLAQGLVFDSGVTFLKHAGGQRGLAKLCPTKLFASIPGSTD